MALIGLATVTLVALILGVRSKRTLNKAFVLVLWGTVAVIESGVLA